MLDMKGHSLPVQSYKRVELYIRVEVSYGQSGGTIKSVKLHYMY